MYEEHPSFDTPSKDVTLFKYFTFEKFISFLASNSIFFCKISEFED